MDSRTPQSSLIKRPMADSGDGKSRKRSCSAMKKVDNDKLSEDKVFKFRVLLPNGTSVDLKIHGHGDAIPVEEFVHMVKQKYLSVVKPTKDLKETRNINWTSEELHFVDAVGSKIRKNLNFENFRPNSNNPHILILHDGSAAGGNYKNMWDLTPDTDLLTELPEHYTFVTALADLIDNSLQAVWSNGRNERRLIWVEIAKNRIEIFDSGSGMDGSDENSIAKWGKMGASLHRLAREQGIGCKPPYLTPFFGMFGYGGPFATMHLGRRALVSSKTKQSEKVYMLHLDREALLNSSSGQTWRTNGGLRYPEKDEIKKAPHRSFTKVEIFEPKWSNINIRQLRCRLKDIYFPYIQCDELSRTGKTEMPIEFQVNGMDLAEILSGEVAVTNVNSCNGPDFTLQLHLTKDAGHTSSSLSPGHTASREANARLKCVYFPIAQGKESIERILEKLKVDGCGITEDYKTFSRVSVRRMGRLLPDARWVLLPFMEPKQKKGDRGQILKRCCYRVKCFIDTDAGFKPTPSKTDLAYQNPYTIALKNFGKKHLDKDKDVRIEIYKDGQELNLSKLEKLYEDWIIKMHNQYDEEIVSGNDEPTFIFHPSNKKELGISSDVLRVHKVFWRKEATWRSGQKIKILKGAYLGHHKTNTYATLEFIILEGWEGDAGGEARLICRPIDHPDVSGCRLVFDNGTASIEIGSSISLPISTIDYGKCVAIDDAVWDHQLEKCSLKVPTAINVLSAKDCSELGIGEALPDDAVDAGFDPPEKILAVVRPASFSSAITSKNLDGKYIVQDKLEMEIQIKFRAEDMDSEIINMFSEKVNPSVLKGFHGIYIFPLGKVLPKLFEKAGLYTFLFSLKGLRGITYEKKVQVRALCDVSSWKLLNDKQISAFTARVGLCFPPLSIACFDKYNNRIPFPFDTKVMIKLSSCKGFTAHVCNMKQHMSSDNFTVSIENVRLESSELDKIRPSYNVTMSIISQDESSSVAIPCQVMPGVPQRTVMHPPKFKKQLLPGQIINDLLLEVFDAYGNHVKENEIIHLEVDGFSVQDKRGLPFKAKDDGFVDLSGLLKVVEGYGKSVSFSVTSYNQMIFKEEFHIEKRELRAAFEVPILCAASTELENLVFEVINTNGEVDESIHNEEDGGQPHTLRIISDSLDIDDSLEYSFSFGRCTVQTIHVPQKEGSFCFEVTHSHHPELHLNVEVETFPFSFQSIGSGILVMMVCSQVHLVQHLNTNNEYVLSPCSEGNFALCQVSSELEAQGKNPHHSPRIRILSLPDSSGLSDHLNKGHENVLCQSSEGKVLHSQESSELETQVNNPHQSAERRTFLLPDSSSHSVVGRLIKCEMKDIEELEEKLCQYGLCIKDHETNVGSLNLRWSNIKQEISNLQASLDLDHDFDCISGKELVIEQIVCKGDSAAAVICRIFQSLSYKDKEIDFAEKILGVVAFLGIVRTNFLSRIFAQYLGEHQMLAIVCKSHADASYLEKHGPDGRVNNAYGLHEFASELGMFINKRYDVLCLDNIRPYMGDCSCDPQRYLLLPNPTLPNGIPSPGFLGYAVNMIELDVNFWHWRTSSGHGLRETLFYRLFGELQVYENRQYMNIASSCIKDGAVSLDGGIMRGNGVISLGYWEADIQFPVVPLESHTYFSPKRVEVTKEIAVKKQELKETGDQLRSEEKALAKVLKKFRKTKEIFESWLDEKEKSFGGLPSKLETDS
ncbi:hypothetical protein ACH5RR_019802 [Cinchona calisaya]|uniref:Gamma-irradiation and mitomycin c induced 1 n=1 Tax=Cinchona calisaya TaxID=153742 RepID=A0ABD2ZQV6_9GENT